jgi:hypothetical protein
MSKPQKVGLVLAVLFVIAVIVVGFETSVSVRR